MKKIVIIILAVFLGLFVIGVIANDTKTKTDKTNVGTPLVVERPTTSTTEKAVDTTSTTEKVVNNGSAEKRAVCLDGIRIINDGLTTLQTGLGYIAQSSDADARAFLAKASEFIDASIQTVRLCAEFAPKEAATFLDSLYAVKDGLRSLANQY